ncbi:MAG: hypothetical protein EA415_05590 [Sphaerobacteraceae bacterium]|nr:MAG: hypothetical protein EA415_05590 [Sphaerobacteraceae bacterium]
MVTPLNVTLLGLLCLALPEIDHQIASIFYFVLRPLTIPIVVIGVAAAVSLLVIIASTISGLRLSFLAFGPLQFHTGGVAGWGIGLNRSWRHFIGSVLLVPKSGSFSPTQAVVSAGTGLVSSFVVLMILIFEARSRGWPGVDDPALGTQLETLLTAAPVAAGIVFVAEMLTGGTVLSGILRGTPAQAQRMLANMTIASRMAIGQRPRDWETELLEEAISLPDSTADHLMGLCFAYLAAVDHKDLAAANQHLRSFERWLQESSSSVRPYVLSSLTGYASLYHERAWLTAVHRQDLDGASEYLNRAADFDVAIPIDLRVKASILALEGDLETARVVAHSGLERLDSFPTMERWRIPFERDLLNRILE